MQIEEQERKEREAREQKWMNDKGDLEQKLKVYRAEEDRLEKNKKRAGFKTVGKMAAFGVATTNHYEGMTEEERTAMHERNKEKARLTPCAMRVPDCPL